MSRGGSKPGERRGGRYKGTPNKKIAAVAEVLAGLGLDPIRQMGEIAMDEGVEVSVRVQALSTSYGFNRVRTRLDVWPPFVKRLRCL
jgi:hypothetical protein